MSKLRKLHDAAPPGPWIYAAQDGRKNQSFSIEHITTGGERSCTQVTVWKAPKSAVPTTELIIYLRNHAADFMSLIAAAKLAKTLIEDDFGTIDDGPAKHTRGQAALNAVTEALAPFEDA